VTRKYLRLNNCLVLVLTLCSSLVKKQNNKKIKKNETICKNERIISLEKFLLHRQKEQRAIFIRMRFVWDLRLGLGLSWGFRDGLELWLGNRLNWIISPKFLGEYERKNKQRFNFPVK